MNPFLFSMFLWQPLLQLSMLAVVFWSPIL